MMRSMRRRGNGFLAVVLGAMAGCDRPEASDRYAVMEGRVHLDDAAASSSAWADSLRCDIDIPPRVRIGQSVPIAVRVTNVADRPLELHLQGTVAFDITISSTDDKVVWRRLEDEVIQSILRIEVLAPGQTLELAYTWDQRTRGGEPVPPGQYSVTAALLTESSQPLSTQPAPLRIASPSH